MSTKNNIFQEYLSEYLKSNKQKKGKILDHVCFVTKIHRKAAIRKFKKLQNKDSSAQNKRGRETFYTPDVNYALNDVWKTANQICGELLHPIIKEYVEILIRDKMWHHNEETTQKLLFMSEATIKRRISHFIKITRRKKGLSSTKPAPIKSIIPVFNGPWNNLPPGHGQIDTVCHCGSSLLGDMTYTVNYTDAAVFWTILRAQWNKGQIATQESLACIKKKLPFDMQGAHPDSGSEFINWFLKDWCDKNNIKLTRSRPNHKNDNMHVEERNGHVVRKFIGYNRLDCKEVVKVLNELYDVLEIYLNHFIPVRRCAGKMKINSQYIRKYEKIPQTPYQRVLDHKDISENVKSDLKKFHQNLNPFVLKKEIDRITKKVFNIQRDYDNLQRLS